MGNCCCRQQQISVQVALKFPIGLEYQSTHEKNAWNHGVDINEWIRNLYTGVNWDHWLIYNDQINGKEYTSHGHCKGILVWNSERYSWLIHSVPNFPSSSSSFPNQLDSLGLLHPEQEFGQSFVCVTGDVIHLHSIIMQISNMNPYIYTSNKNFSDDINDLLQKKTRILDFNEYSLDKDIKHISKSHDIHKDIYEDYLYQTYQTSMLVETWMRGEQIPNSLMVKNIKSIKTGTKEWNETQDHSKWAISDKSSSIKWVFIGDLNRMISQMHRGGGGILIQNDLLWHSFHTMQFST